MVFPANTHPRFLPLEGSINFRDFGGYATTDGRQVVWGRLFRCGALSMLTAQGKAAFSDLNISVICDLRRVDEAAYNPTPAEPPFHVVHIPISQGSTGMLQQSIRDASQSAADRIRFMTDINRELASDHTAEYRTLFEQLLNAQDGFLLHCSAGKDRTGFGAALILHALGVPEQDILGDYLLTNEAKCLRYFMENRMREHYGAAFDDDSLSAVGGVRLEYLQAAMQQLHDTFGSVDHYLEEIGVDSVARKTLRDRLTVAVV
ncbi:MAG: tyrosine-protein phosphatase [Pseudomonadales bacterium]|nr:tyrosine-protein phosphatase [Pseudomonadales bacterium]